MSQSALCDALVDPFSVICRLEREASSRSQPLLTMLSRVHRQTVGQRRVLYDTQDHVLYIIILTKGRIVTV